MPAFGVAIVSRNVVLPTDVVEADRRGAEAAAGPSE